MEYKKWNRFVRDGLVINKQSNTKYGFSKMCKLFGKEYIDYIKASWQTNQLSAQEFMAINGDIPQSFMDKYIT